MEAARCRGQSLTSFVLSAALKATEKVGAEPEKVKAKGKNGGLAFFARLCREAAKGGASNYATAGNALMWRIGSLLDDTEDKRDRLERLDYILGFRNDKRTLAWFDENLPRCLELVPPRRRRQFLKGIYKVDEEDWDILKT
jgi:hypothetical protein